MHGVAKMPREAKRCDDGDHTEGRERGSSSRNDSKRPQLVAVERRVCPSVKHGCRSCVAADPIVAVVGAERGTLGGRADVANALVEASVQFISA